ncbi:rho GDP dissociation inhibitor [Dispira simplex]|nr:rho GDP dissociation inhibitor [Dispira simplex]
MSNLPQDEELLPTQTEGYKVGEKKTLEEYQNLDANDDSLNRWKQSLGLGASSGPVTDPRSVIIESLALEMDGRDIVTMDLSSQGSIAKLKSDPVLIKEGIKYRLKVRFRVQHDVLSGLKFLQHVKRSGIVVDRTEQMLGSFGPSADVYEQKFPFEEEAPKGMLARGSYKAKSKFIDDDGNTHLEWEWHFDIKKDWSK